MIRFCLICCLLAGLLPSGRAQLPLWLVHETSDTINTLGDDGDFIWLGTRNEGLVRLRKSTGQSAAFGSAFGIPDPYIFDLLVDSEGFVWAGTKAGLTVFGGTETVIIDSANSPLPHNHVRAVALANGMVWAGTWAGLGRLDDVGWTIYSTADGSLPDDQIRCLTVQDTTVWVGMQSGGLARLRGGQWTYYTADNSGLAHNSVWALTNDQKGNIWIATANGLNQFDGNTWTLYDTQNSDIGSNWINNMTVDANDHLWLATHEGLTFYDGAQFENFTATNSELPGQTAEDVLVDPLGDAWIGMFNGNLAAYNKEGVKGGLKGKIEFKVYPVPFSENTKLEITNPNSSDDRYALDFWRVNGQHLGSIKDFTTHLLDLSSFDLPAGVVLFTLSNQNGEVGNGKIVVIKREK